MERTIIIKIEDSYIDEDTGEPQTTEDFENTALDSFKTYINGFLDMEIGDVKVLDITVK